MFKVKELFLRFRAWQRDPFTFKPLNDEPQSCLNCGLEFKGDYCPRCGQKTGEVRLGWMNVWTKIIDVWDVKQRVLPRTIFHLLFRPGYMISDYLDGRRRPYYSPVMLAFIFGILDAFVESIVGTRVLPAKTDIQSVSLTAFQNWCEHNESWSFVIHNLSIIPATWLLYRYSPRHPRHTPPETFFILIFISSLLQLLNLLNDIFGKSFEVPHLLFVPFIILFCYGPVFGYGIWGTIWRFVICLLTSAILIPLVAFGVDFVMGYPVNTEYFIQFLVFFAILAVVVVLATLLSRHTERLRLAKAAAMGQADESGGWKIQFEKQKNRNNKKKKRKMNKEQVAQLAGRQEQFLLNKYFGNLVKEAAVERPETIGDYTPDLPLKIEAEYKDFLARLWDEWRKCNAPKDTRTIDDLLDKQQLRQQMTDDDREAIAHAHREAERRTLWERITHSNHKDVTYYKGLLQEYTRDLLFVMREDFLEEIKDR